MGDSNGCLTTKELENLKFTCAKELRIDLKHGYNGHLSASECGRLGGYMVKRMVEEYKRHDQGRNK